MRLFAIPLPLLLLACVGACGSSQPPPARTVDAPASQPTKTAAALRPAVEAATSHALRRSVVREVVAGGLGAFLQHVAVDDTPVLLAGKFHGFRIAGLRDAAWWTGVDLRPGDVVVSVNGFPIEHPEEALEAFRSLDVSSELRVSYERDGAPRELRYAIVDDAPTTTGAVPSRAQGRTSN
jgi:type II secretory pathway component PulC